MGDVHVSLDYATASRHDALRGRPGAFDRAVLCVIPTTGTGWVNGAAPESLELMYGGDTAGAGTAVRQEFPVDAESIAMFEREGLNASVTNTWAMEIEPGARFLYELARPGGRLFQVEFDLSRPVPAPPAPWGRETPAD